MARVENNLGTRISRRNAKSSAASSTPLRHSAGHHGIDRRSRKKPPVGPLFGSVAAQTGVSAPSSTERVAPDPPMSVRTHPGQTELTRMPLSPHLDPHVRSANLGDRDTASGKGLAC